MSAKSKFFLIVLAACGYTSLHLFSDFEGQEDLASKSKKRTTELGTAKPVDNISKELLNIKINDPTMAAKWGLVTTESQKAWRISTGSRDIIVAIIDTGIDVNHPDLKNNLWRNPGETGKDKLGRDKEKNGVDDDGNGYVDDVHGWNFAGNNSDISDNHGHGTHIAGIVGASGDKLQVGVAPRVSLMILKYYDPKAPGVNNLTNTVRAIRYATAMKAKIINYSGGGIEKSSDEEAAVREARNNGILFVAAAGNEQSNSDVKGYFPADYDLDNIISVTAVERDTESVLPSSNYGKKSVDLAAPGKNIYSTLPNGQYGQMTGTSQATAFVTGVAALIMSHYRDFPPSKVIQHITETGDWNEEKLAQKTRTGKRLNTYRALILQSQGVAANGTMVVNAPSNSAEKFSTQETSDDGGPVSEGKNVSALSAVMKEIVKRSAAKPEGKIQPTLPPSL